FAGQVFWSGAGYEGPEFHALVHATKRDRREVESLRSDALDQSEEPIQFKLSRFALGNLFPAKQDNGLHAHFSGAASNGSYGEGDSDRSLLSRPVRASR